MRISPATRAVLIAGLVATTAAIAGCGGGDAQVAATTTSDRTAQAAEASRGAQAVLQTDIVNDLPVDITVTEDTHTGYWVQPPGPAFPDGPTGTVPAGKMVRMFLRPVTYHCYVPAKNKDTIGATFLMRFAAGAGESAPLGYKLNVLRRRSKCGGKQPRAWQKIGNWALKSTPSSTTLKYVDPATGAEKVATITGKASNVTISPPAG